MAAKGHVLAPPQGVLALRRRGGSFAAACAFAATMLGGLGLFAAFAPGFLGQILGIENRATVGLVVFAVFAVSSFGETLLERAFGVRALVAGSIGLIAAMGLLALGLALSSLPFLVAGGILAGLGQGASFRHGLAAINDASRIRLALARAQRDGVALPSGVLADEWLSTAASLGYGHRDSASVFAALSASGGKESNA